MLLFPDRIQDFDWDKSEMKSLFDPQISTNFEPKDRNS